MEDWFDVLVTLSHTFLILNSSLNIFIYLVKVNLIHFTYPVHGGLDGNFLMMKYLQEKKFREIFSRRKKRRHSFDGFLPKTLQRPLMRKNLSVDKWLKFSKSDSLDSDYSQSTSVIGFSSRQTSQDRNLAGTSSSEWFSSTEKIEETSLSANCRDFHSNCRYQNNPQSTG